MVAIVVHSHFRNFTGLKKDWRGAAVAVSPKLLIFYLEADIFFTNGIKILNAG